MSKFDKLYESIMNEGSPKVKKYKVNYLSDWQNKEGLGGGNYEGSNKFAMQRVGNKVTTYQKGNVETFEFSDEKQAKAKIDQLYNDYIKTKRF